MTLSPRATVELFHMVFLRALVARGEDKALVGLKGGCNLRFYFGSVRYSEDIDFDVVVIAKDTLKNKVDRLLASPVVTSPLKAHGIEVLDVSAPKQTETTQRWKVGLGVLGLGAPLRTKIEFSRRKSARALAGAAFEAPSASVVRPYGLTPFLAMHYTTHTATFQKIHALASRTEPQARDVFDLDLLFAKPDALGLTLDFEQRRLVPLALEHAMSISFDEYASKVVAYLDPDQAELFAGRAAWETMQDAVIRRLEALV